MTAPKQPRDRQPKKAPARRPNAKAVATEKPGQAFKFNHDGKIYSIPNAANYAGVVDGGVLMDAVLGGAAGETVMAMSLLKAASDDMKPDAVQALRGKPSSEFMEIVNDWLLAGGVIGQGES